MKLKAEMKLKANVPFRHSGLLKPFLLELAVSSIFTPPYLDFTFKGKMLGGDYTYSVNDLVVVISLVKCLCILRLYYHYGRWA